MKKYKKILITIIFILLSILSICYIPIVRYYIVVTLAYTDKPHVYKIEKKKSTFKDKYYRHKHYCVFVSTLPTGGGSRWAEPKIDITIITSEGSKKLSTEDRTFSVIKEKEIVTFKVDTTNIKTEQPLYLHVMYFP